MYTRLGVNEGISPTALGEVDVESFRRWVVDRYPARGYPAVVVGSANGAAVFLAAMLGVPWLPQTFLVPVRRSLHPDAVRADLAWGRERARPFLAANPDVALTQMHDPNQDRLMVSDLAYFRTKCVRLGGAYESFLETVLEPGGTIVSLECGYEWPAVDAGDRHRYQVGGLGGLDPAEYYRGSDRVASFLAAQGSSVRRWDAPTPDRRIPEAEWGFEPALREDLDRLAAERGYDRRRLAFDHPQELSAFVADLYRRRYAARNRPTDRLFVQSFALVEPWWTLRTGSVPYWAPFNSRSDVERLESYLDRRRPYDEIRANLFSNGVESAGIASAARWRSVVDRGRNGGGFVGVDAERFPYDVESNTRYHDDVPERIADRYPHPPPVPFDRFDRRAPEAAADDRCSVRWLDG